MFCQVWAGISASPRLPWTSPIDGGGPYIPNQAPAGTITFGGECFIYDDGQAYMYYGIWWISALVKRNLDMTSTMTGRAIRFFPHAGYTLPNGPVTGCMETPYIVKRNGKYYYIFGRFVLRLELHRQIQRRRQSPRPMDLWGPQPDPLNQSRPERRCSGISLSPFAGRVHTGHPFASHIPGGAGIPLQYRAEPSLSTEPIKQL